LHRELFPVQAGTPEFEAYRPPPDVDLQEVLIAMAEVVQRMDRQAHHHIEMETLSTRERMSQILEQLQGPDYYPFESLFAPEEGRTGVVVTFLATLELVKSKLIELVQLEPFSPIHVRLKSVQSVSPDDEFTDEQEVDNDDES